MARNRRVRTGKTRGRMLPNGLRDRATSPHACTRSLTLCFRSPVIVARIRGFCDKVECFLAKLTLPKRAAKLTEHLRVSNPLFGL
jgi:hypothetical protein